MSGIFVKSSVLSHVQSDVERGFSVNKEMLQDNLQEKLLI